MSRLILSLLALVSICPALFAGQSVLEPRREDPPVIVSIARSGAISINHRRVPLKRLVATLRSQGISVRSRITVEGEEGTSYGHISRVMETLFDGGLFPPGTID